MFMGFIGLLKVAITQWIQVSGEHEAALKTSHLSPCVVGIREKNINEEPFFKAAVSSVYIVQTHLFCM